MWRLIWAGSSMPSLVVLLSLTEGSVTKEISYTVGRNPNWNPEIHYIWNPEIHSEIQKSTEIRKSTLKSGNPIQDSIKILRNNYTTRTCTCTDFLWRNKRHHSEWPLYLADLRGRVQRSFFQGDVIAIIIVRCVMYDEHAVWYEYVCKLTCSMRMNMYDNQRTRSMRMYMYDNQRTRCLCAM